MKMFSIPGLAKEYFTFPHLIILESEENYTWFMILLYKKYVYLSHVVSMHLNVYPTLKMLHVKITIHLNTPNQYLCALIRAD